MNKLDKIARGLLEGQDDFVWCPQGEHVVMKDDYDPQAGMCGVCINEAMAEASEWFGRKGLIPTAEEQEAND